MSFISEQNSWTFVYHLDRIEKINSKGKEREHFLYYYLAHFTTEHIHFRWTFYS